MKLVVKLLLLLSGFWSGMVTADEPLVQRLETLVSELPPGSVYSIQVRDPANGKVLYEQGAHLNLVPASVLKVVTATLAYETLGENFRYTTRIRSENPVTGSGTLKGAVSLSFSGDPSFKREHLDQLIAELEELGVKNIAGNFWLDDDVFTGYDRAGGVSWDDLNICFAAPAAPMILDRNCFHGWLRPGKNKGDPAIIEYDRPEWLLEVDNKVITRNAPDGGRCLQQVTPSTDYEYQLDGCISPRSRGLRMAFSVNNVERAVEKYVLAALQEHGIHLQGQIISGSPRLVFSHILAQHESETLPQLLKPVLDNSDNLYSDSILKTVGHQLSGKPGSYALGIESARTILGDKGGRFWQQSPGGWFRVVPL